MATLRELKGRIGSVASTGKITGAMKMISSAKMHKYEQALKRLVPFRSQVQSVISHLLATDGEYTSPLIEAREVKKIAYLVYASDDVGNSQLAFAQSLYGHEEYKPSSHGDEVLHHGETRDAKDTSE